MSHDELKGDETEGMMALCCIQPQTELYYEQ